MKEYKLEGKPENDNTWHSTDRVFNSVYDVIDIMNQEKKIDESYGRKWEYRILFRKVSEWEVL